MQHRVLIEFVVDVPSAEVAKDVRTRLVHEHQTRLCEVLTAVMGHPPLRAPDQVGLRVFLEPVAWSNTAQEWIVDDDDKADDEDEDNE